MITRRGLLRGVGFALVAIGSSTIVSGCSTGKPKDVDLVMGDVVEDRGIEYKIEAVGLFPDPGAIFDGLKKAGRVCVLVTATAIKDDVTPLFWDMTKIYGPDGQSLKQSSLIRIDGYQGQPDLSTSYKKGASITYLCPYGYGGDGGYELQFGFVENAGRKAKLPFVVSDSGQKVTVPTKSGQKTVQQFEDGYMNPIS